MLPSFLLSLREGLETALIIGIVFGALRKIRQTEYNSVVWLGTISAGAVSLVSAIILYGFGTSLEGETEHAFEGITMLLAAIVLTWMVLWMQRQSYSFQSELEADVRRATVRGSKYALFSLAFIAVLREGTELALMLNAAVFASHSSLPLLGVFFGLDVAFILGWLIYTTSLRLDLRRFFLVTGAILILFAAGLVAHGVSEIVALGWINPIIEQVWNINSLLAEDSLIGELFTALLGYNANPSLTELIAYLGYFVAIGLVLQLRKYRGAAFAEGAITNH